MKKILKVCGLGWLVAAGAAVAADGNSYLRALTDGYDAASAYQLRAEWSLPKFLTVTPAGAYSYLHLAEQLPHATIYRNGPVSELPRKPQKSLQKLDVEWQGEHFRLHDLVAAENSPLQGVMVVHRGEVVYEQYPGMRPFDNHVWMSNAKPMASLLIGQLQEEGLLDVHETVAEYLPRAVGTHWEKVRLIDVLNMETGLDTAESPARRADPNSGFSRFMVSEVGLPNIDGKVQTHNDALFAVNRLRDPGQGFEYSSINTQLLGLVIEAVTGQRLADVLAERIWMPAGMEGDAQLGLTPQGNGIIHGLVSSRLADMARFGMLYTPSWSGIAKRRLVSAQMLRDIQSGGQPESYLKGTLGPHLQQQFGELPRANAYQWDAVFADGDIYKSGMNGQGLYVSPKQDLVVAWFANGPARVPMEKIARTIALSADL